MNENQTNKGRFGIILRVAALSLAAVLVWQIASPSMLYVVGALAEEGSALSRIYGILSENAGEPTTAQDYYEQANLAIGKRNYEEALEHLEKARSLAAPEDAALLSELYLKSASVYVINGQMDQALEALDEAIRQDPASTQALLLRAQLAIERGDSRTAVADLAAYVEISPYDLTTRQTLAQLLEGIADYAGARVQYEALYAAQAEDESHRLNAIRCQFLSGEYEEALAAFDSYIADQRSDSPYLSVATFLRAACLMQLGRFGEAAEGFAKAKEHGYHEATCYEQMMACYFESEAYPQAVEYGEKLIGLEASSSLTDLFYQRMGASMVQMERYEEAVEYLNKSSEINPALAGNAYYRGVSFLALKRYEEAVADFTASIEQGFLTQFCYYNRGVCYVQLLDYEKAIEDMGMTLSSGEDAALIDAAKNILWQLAAYYENIQTTQQTAN